MKADKNGNLSLNCYSDASFNVHADAKSHSGITIFLGATLFKSYKIKMLNKSVAESELSVLSDVTSLLVHERGPDLECNLPACETSPSLPCLPRPARRSLPAQPPRVC